MSTVTFLTLPADLHFCILQLLAPKALCALRETCKFFLDFIDAHGERVWRKIAIQSSYLEQTAQCTGCRAGTWSGIPDAFQGKKGSTKELAAVIDGQRSALGSFDGITTWADFGACVLVFIPYVLDEPRTEASSSVKRRCEIDKRWRRNDYSRFFSIISPCERVLSFHVDASKRLLVTTSFEGTCISRTSQRLELILFDPGGVAVQRLRDGATVWHIPQDQTSSQVFSFFEITTCR
jgi:hypothetical protein